MKQFYSILLFAIFIISCSSPEKGNVTITGNIKGLKKGTLFLQKIQDTILINVDSVIINGKSEFIMHTTIKEPEVHYLHLEKKDGAQYNDRITFFAEPGEISIVTTLSGFEKDARIKGGENETKFQEFKKINQRYNDRNLKLIKENFEASKQNDEEKLEELDDAYRKLLKQKYLYSINFAINNKKLEVSPYVAINEIYDANIKFLDTIANSLTPRVKNSLYGKQLIEFIKERKAEEKSIEYNDN